MVLLSSLHLLKSPANARLGLALLVLLVLLLKALLLQCELGFLFGISVALLLFVRHFASDPGERLMLSSMTENCSLLTSPTWGQELSRRVAPWSTRSARSVLTFQEIANFLQ